MFKKCVSLLLAAALAVSLLCFPASAAGGLDNFKRGGGYQAGQYSDVPEGNTFAANVQAGYEFGIMKGSGGGKFGVADNITRLASVIVACRLHAIYYTGGTAAMDEAYTGGAGEKALAYARDNGILCAFDNVNAPATRQEFAAVLSSALPDEALPAINIVEDGAIPDVPETNPYAAQIYRLYRAGVVTGSGGGVYSPASNITRGAACAIATRMCDPALRKTITLTKAPAAPAATRQEGAYNALKQYVLDHYNAGSNGYYQYREGRYMGEDWYNIHFVIYDSEDDEVSLYYHLQVEGEGYTLYLYPTPSGRSYSFKIFYYTGHKGMGQPADFVASGHLDPGDVTVLRYEKASGDTSYSNAAREFAKSAVEAVVLFGDLVLSRIKDGSNYTMADFGFPPV